MSRCFLPAYSPELNKIELLWHRCKHYWLTPADYVGTLPFSTAQPSPVERAVGKGIF